MRKTHILCTDCRGKCCTFILVATFVSSGLMRKCLPIYAIKSHLKGSVRVKEEERRLDSLYYVDLCIWGKGESGSAGVGESGLELPDDPIPAA